MPDCTVDAQPAGPLGRPERQVQLTITLGTPGTPGKPGTQHWRARVVMADASVIEFASPFELVRFLAWPLATPAAGRGGLR